MMSEVELALVPYVECMTGETFVFVGKCTSAYEMSAMIETPMDIFRRSDIDI